MTHLRRRIEDLALETFSVVLGVVLAFAANAWHDRRSHEQSACEALSAIRRELASNDSILKAKLPYHTAMRDSLDALLARTQTREVPGGLRAIHNWSGLQPSQLVDDAWQTARSSQEVQYLPYALVIELSKTYGMQQRITDATRGLYTAVYTPAFASGGVASIGAMYSFLNDLVSNEGHLQEQYTRAAKVTARTCRGS